MYSIRQKLTRLIVASIFLLVMNGCYYGVNKETSEIANLDISCLDTTAWSSLCNKYNTNNIKDTSLLQGLQYVKEHFIEPTYVLYFDQEPIEIVGCDYYSIRVVFKPNYKNQALDGLSPQLTDQEQVRIRNRILKILMEYQCSEGKIKTEELMKEPAVFSKKWHEKK